jgi:hypothetical protein
MRRLLLLPLMALVSALLFSQAASSSSAAKGVRDGTLLNCEENGPLCTEAADPLGYEYTGHDEPSLLFYSNTSGSGNTNLYRMTLPTDPPTAPTQAGTGGTFNFQLHPAFWFGMAMCDDQSSPNPGGSAFAGPNVPCTPDSDANIYTSTNPADPNYIGKHPGSAFMEMQFYPPGWIKWPAGDSCDPTKWCAALNIDSLSTNANTGVNNNASCLSIAGIEPVNFAFITRSGKAQAPANPVDATLTTYTASPSVDLMMQSGDQLTIDMHDTSAGFTVIVNDLTSGQSGSMTASVANGFGQVNYDPSGTTCTVTHAPFHPQYATSSENTRVVWAAHSYNVAFSDEIGHFEFCNAVTQQTGDCTQDGVGDADTALGGAEDDEYCFVPPFQPPVQSTKIKIGGCFGTDIDFDGVPYQKVWPGSTTNSAAEASLDPSPIKFTSPRFNGTQPYSRIAFEADLPRIEFATNPPCQRHVSNPADPSPGTGCVNPPAGANFYPIYSTTGSSPCVWQLGGANIPGSTNTFGGTSTAEYGPLLLLAYPAVGGVTTRYNDFRNVFTNSC